MAPKYPFGVCSTGIYDNLVRDNDIMDAPHNPRQIVNKQALYQKKKDQTHSSCNNCHHNKNVADHIQNYLTC